MAHLPISSLEPKCGTVEYKKNAHKYGLSWLDWTGIEVHWRPTGFIDMCFKCPSKSGSLILRVRVDGETGQSFSQGRTHWLTDWLTSLAFSKSTTYTTLQPQLPDLYLSIYSNEYAGIVVAATTLPEMNLGPATTTTLLSGTTRDNRGQRTAHTFDR